MKTRGTIYLDHQATTPVDPRVMETMLPYFTDHFGNPHASDHVIGRSAARAVDDAAAQVAALIGADADDIIFTSGATEANNLALLGLADEAARGTRKRILISAIEHKSVAAVAYVLMTRLGFRIEAIPVTPDGMVDIDAFESMLNDDVFLVSVMLVNNEIGSIQPIERISTLARQAGALLHTDAAQGPLAIDMASMARSADLLSLSGHKFYGPQGVGALYASRTIRPRLRPIFFGGGQQGNVRAGTLPTPLCVGLGAAALLSSASARDERERLRRCRDRFVRGVLGLDWPVYLNGPDLDHRHPGNANLRFYGFTAHDILAALQPKLAASTGSACASWDGSGAVPEPSHVLRAIGLSRAQAEASIRFSLGRSTTDAHVDEAIGLIDQALTTIACGGLVAATVPAASP
ncbi:MAG: cysteine desulfurase family protein [Alphaproteobacteria bacterium]